MPKNHKPDIEKGGKAWLYSDAVKEHFYNPKNVMTDKLLADYKADGVGEVGSPACGDVMRMWIKVDPKTKKVKDCKWKTFGCASAIAATSVLSVMVMERGGMTIERAKKIKPQDIVARLQGLPSVKIHCSVLGDQALRAAIRDYEGRVED
ncbi:iron-sulfur cluster assembly scaffold protein [Patescibacteria group bacterium]|nr:iron-sulfur cluster assembly scaffold protein [Patescibacteria group bacterium]